jgi:hypothetical protein
MQVQTTEKTTNNYKREKMKKISVLLITFSLAAAFSAADAQSHDSTAAMSLSNLSIYGRFQLMGLAQSVLDKVQSDKRLYLFLKQARLGIRSDYDDIKLNFQTAFGGEEIVASPSPGVSLQLLDFSADIPLSGSVRIKVGQFKVPYGREEFADGGSLSFGDRSIQYNAFVIGRDVGLSLYNTSGPLTGILGVFTGGGRDVPLRYLPEKLGFPMLTLRLGINDGYDGDVTDLKQTSYDSPEGSAFFVNGMYIRDFRIGHSTVLNVKTIDKSMLLDPSWNPYIAAQPLDQGRFWQIGADAAVRRNAGADWTVSGEAELNHGAYHNMFGSIFLTGGRLQFAAAKKPYEIDLRYAFILPDKNLAYVSSSHQSFPIMDDKMVHEITLGITYFLKGDRLKLTADLPLLLQVPVMEDPVSGSYVLTQQPAQVSYLASGGKVVRQNIVQGRMQLQYSF